MIWQLNNFAEQFVVRSVTQFVKVLESLRAVAETPGAVNHRVDALSIGRLGEPAPRAGGVGQPGDDGGAVDACSVAPRRSDRDSATHAVRNDL